MKITKKSVLEFVRDCRRDVFGWTICGCGFYVKKDGTLHDYIHYVGQGVNIDIYESNFVAKIEVVDIISDYGYNQKMMVETIYDRVVDLIDDANYIPCENYFERVSRSDLRGVHNIEKVKMVEYVGGDKIAITYKDDSVLYYCNVHGTWGFPVKFI